MSGVFGRNLKRLRLARGWTQDAVASAIKKPKSRISEWEKRDTPPKAGEIQAVAGLFGVTADQLLSGPIDEPEIKTRGRLDQHPTPKGADAMSDQKPGLEAYAASLAQLVLAMRDPKAEDEFSDLVYEAYRRVRQGHAARFSQDAADEEPATKA